MSKVILKGHIIVPPNQLDLVVEALPEHVSLTRAEKGCLCFSVSQRTDDRYTFDVYEEFVDQSAFDAHQARAANSIWAKVTKNVERHYIVS